MKLPIAIDIEQAVSQRYTYNTPKQSQPVISASEADLHNEIISAFYAPSQFKASKFSAFSISSIMGYLKRTHQYYIDCKLIEIEMELKKLTFKEEYQQSWMPILSQLFTKFSRQLTTHIQDEERKLFPYIEFLIDAHENGKLQFDFSQKIELVSYLLEHDDFADQSLKFIIDVLEKKSSYFYDKLALGVLTSRLKLLETDLLIHAKVEDEVLIPKAIQIEIEVLR